ncbi:hypothetical protein COW36_14185 [bacterium (Candidatus Blackallbacteria) CG17_big_fil_post_rev_8_21_14_2_50_48_46]|uniref:Uncharacterized protein n=1 Tax=bacterium (Candidatus Blackallbacteria) CG17_big_fil_post_rev_8_21_14_2_50_48_46 TaxID=2014261 RepID=A0A2M7G371_9BACT|nr:MAG: hypothetical protein COW64_23655 [bacterium (Candidatus Blackallbacteria) CG18_big_fil_WC_8_21_14_2_50_49_26]PIW16268.1 MAG: hypothetical protein COW36_14185 [bacterium (Candidatus Blackallbacteria) CG17_big_fil_post_rev_8_21_14_2_50_48_46]PIW49851.1 MAG: hypothetical protein COW20_04120 [bacterium (Candidatus Blackallbacteria) CG13_big_fil_rev_8_21_14_2_50_49_14]
MKTSYNHLPTIKHAGLLEELHGIPGYLHPAGFQDYGASFNWPFYSGGISGVIQVNETQSVSAIEDLPQGAYLLRTYFFGQLLERKAFLKPNGSLDVQSPGPLALPGSVFVAELEREDLRFTAMLRESSQGWSQRDGQGIQTFLFYRSMTRKLERIIENKMPEEGFAKLRISMGEQPTLFPLQLSPSVLDVTGRRVPLFYQDAINRLADLLLAYRPPYGRTLVYAGGDLDYFDQFAMHEVFRLLGVRNLTGTNEFGLRAAARCLELQAGEESPLVTLDQALEGPDRLFLLSGWNGFVSHLPVFNRLVLKEELDAWLIETCVTESAKILAARLSPERILLIRTGGDSLLALGVAHEILKNYPGALDQRFISQWTDKESLTEFLKLAQSEAYEIERVAETIAPDPAYLDRLVAGMRSIAASLVETRKIPVHIPGAGLSQTQGVVAHGLWNNLLALLGKLGVSAEGELRGGPLRLPYEKNDQTQVQGLAQDRFFGNLPLDQTGCQEAALRMGLPESAYAALLAEPSRPALEYPTLVEPGKRELIICIGQGLEGQMMDRTRWIEKLKAPETLLVVIDPMPGPFFLRHAALCLPTAPEVSQGRLYQNGEWRLTLALPRRAAPPETRSACTLLYDTMAEVSQHLRSDPDLNLEHADLAEHVKSGYLQKQFEAPEQGGALERAEGEVCRFVLWDRIQAYLKGNSQTRGPLYCRPEHADGLPVSWDELLSQGSLIYGGVGTSRHRQEPSKPALFHDLYRGPVSFKFLLPQANELELPEGIVLNSGCSTLSDHAGWIRFAIGSFHSGKTLASMDMPKEQILYVSEALAQAQSLQTGQKVRVTNLETERSAILPIAVTSRLKGRMVYLSYHHSVNEIEQDSYLNLLTYRSAKCARSGLPYLKSAQIKLEALQEQA